MNGTGIQAALLLGSNLGDRAGAIKMAGRLIEAAVGPVTGYSSFYECSPWGFSGQPCFLNRALLVQTCLAEMNLLDVLKAIEIKMGRVSSGKWKARLIDIDILFYGTRIFSSERLTIPHPLISQRKFALVPMAEIIPDFIHPQWNKSITALLRECKDPGTATRVSIPFQELA